MGLGLMDFTLRVTGAEPTSTRHEFSFSTQGAPAVQSMGSVLRYDGAPMERLIPLAASGALRDPLAAVVEVVVTFFSHTLFARISSFVRDSVAPPRQVIPNFPFSPSTRLDAAAKPTGVDVVLRTLLAATGRHAPVIITAKRTQDFAEENIHSPIESYLRSHRNFLKILEKSFGNVCGVFKWLKCMKKSEAPHGIGVANDESRKSSILFAFDK
jgi:hypothetical protein